MLFRIILRQYCRKDIPYCRCSRQRCRRGILYCRCSRQCCRLNIRYCRRDIPHCRFNILRCRCLRQHCRKEIPLRILYIPYCRMKILYCRLNLRRRIAPGQTFLGHLTRWIFGPCPVQFQFLAFISAFFGFPEPWDHPSHTNPKSGRRNWKPANKHPLNLLLR